MNKLFREARERLEKATPGPWDNEPASQEWKDNSSNNFELCRHSPSDLEAALQAIDLMYNFIAAECGCELHGKCDACDVLAKVRSLGGEK